MDIHFKFSLGQMVRHNFLDVSGRVEAISIFLTGCARYGVRLERLTEDGLPHDLQWFDEVEIKKHDGGDLSSNVPMLNIIRLEEDAPGGPRPAPKRRPDPRR